MKGFGGYVGERSQLLSFDNCLKPLSSGDMSWTIRWNRPMMKVHPARWWASRIMKPMPLRKS